MSTCTGLFWLNCTGSLGISSSTMKLWFESEQRTSNTIILISRRADIHLNSLVSPLPRVITLY
jgi:hypothetical protein